MKKKDECRCDNCKKKVDFLYSHDKIVEWLCKKCFEKLHGDIQQIPDNWELGDKYENETSSV